jgi:hypothetical protein
MAMDDLNTTKKAKLDPVVAAAAANSAAGAADASTAMMEMEESANIKDSSSSKEAAAAPVSATTATASACALNEPLMITLMKSCTQQMMHSARDIVMRLRPIVLRIQEHGDAASLCSSLEKEEYQDFLCLGDGIRSTDMGVILKHLDNIYLEARTREAASISTFTEEPPAGQTPMMPVDTLYCEAAIEMRNAILHSELKYINNDNKEASEGIQTFQGFVPDVQNPGKFMRPLIRPEDAAFWNKCIHLSLHENHPVCGVGNAGIGKTCTTLYLLKMLLMHHQAPVVYTIRQPGDGRDVFYEFVPIVVDTEKKKPVVTDITVKVYKILPYDKTDFIPSMRNEAAFYVVDPGKFKDSCDDVGPSWRPRFILNAANDQKYAWGGNEFVKYRCGGWSSPGGRLSSGRGSKRQGVFVYAGPWTARQVLLAKPYLATIENLNDQDILHRFRLVGGSLRDIVMFHEVAFKQRVASALVGLNGPTVQALARGICSFAFNDAGASSPSSVLIGIGPDYDTRFDDQRHSGIYKITLTSDYVEECVAIKFVRMSWFARLDDEECNAGNLGNLFESYVRAKFSQAPVVFTIGNARESLRDEPAALGNKKKKKNYEPVDNEITVGGSNRTIVRVSNMCAAVRSDTTQQNLYYSKSNNSESQEEPLIDMIYRVDGGFDAIQATIGAKVHDADDSEKIKQLMLDLDLQPAEMLRIFYAVPSSRFTAFKTSTAAVRPLLASDPPANVVIYHVAVRDDDDDP